MPSVTILWLWAGAPLLTLGCITALLVVDAQWKQAREWRRATWPTSKGGRA